MKLYKYHSINKNLIWSLIEKKNWYSKFENLNDPFEALFNDETNTGIYGNLRSSMRICCFSKNRDEILMWSHYADEHRGVCLEFECGENTDFLGSIFNVEYENNLTKIDNVELTKNGNLLINNETNGKWVRRKLGTWKYEEEVRKILIDDHNSSNGLTRDFPGKLAALYFGIRASNEYIELIQNITSNEEDLKYFKVELNIETGKMSKLERINRT
ncbi:MAG: hypothetical protein ACI9G9_000728 [Psychromonas sp.]|jgi:hypothetical protein